MNAAVSSRELNPRCPHRLWMTGSVKSLHPKLVNNKYS